MRFAVLYGSVRSERQGIKAARFIVRMLEGRGHDVTLLDAEELALPMLDRMHKEYDEGEAPETMQHAHEVLEAAQGYVVVGGEYNHSVPPALKNLLDTFQQEYYYKPAAIMSYSAGPFGGVRAAVHYRVILAELGMATTSVILAVSKVQDAFDDEGNDATDKKDQERRAQRFLNELEWYTEALTRQREACPDPMHPCGDRNAEKADEQGQA